MNGTNDIGYCYGDALLYDAGADTQRIGAWQFLAHVNGRTAEQDRVDDEENSIPTPAAPSRTSRRGALLRVMGLGGRCERAVSDGRDPDRRSRTNMPGATVRVARSW